MHNTQLNQTRSVILIRASFKSDSWQQLDILSGDVTIIQVRETWGKLTIFNIYNDGRHNNMINLLSEYMYKNANELSNSEIDNAPSIWLSDFNRHHPHWDNPDNTCLFTNEAVAAAEALIEVVAEAGLNMVLLSNTPTHLHNISKCWSRLNNVFLLNHSAEILLFCNTLSDQHGVCMDHLPIVTELDLSTAVTPPMFMPNFREVDWQEFWKTVGIKLGGLSPPEEISHTGPTEQSVCRTHLCVTGHDQLQHPENHSMRQD